MKKVVILMKNTAADPVLAGKFRSHFEGHVLLVEYDRSTSTLINLRLTTNGFSVTSAHSVVELHEALALGEFDVVVAGRNTSPVIEGDWKRTSAPDIPVVILPTRTDIMDTGSEQNLIHEIRAALDWLTSP